MKKVKMFAGLSQQTYIFFIYFLICKWWFLLYARTGELFRGSVIVFVPPMTHVSFGGTGAFVRRPIFR